MTRLAYAMEVAGLVAIVLGLATWHVGLAAVVGGGLLVFLARGLEAK